MSAQYKAVLWNRQKKWYDLALIAGVGGFLAMYLAVTFAKFPTVTAEIALIRAFGAAGILLLHVILCIGPLARLNPKFLPLLYNRRHMGVTMFLLGLTHSVLVVLTYHAGGDLNPFLAIFADGSLTDLNRFAFQSFGFVALIILFLMAATSHDFWLANLSAPVWKTLHMGVYVAYAALMVHVSFGILQAEISATYVALSGLGMGTVVVLHLLAGVKAIRLDVETKPEENGWVPVGPPEEIPDNRAKIVTIAGERVAVFRYDGKVSAVSNVCQHQNGPLGEGRIVYGCITCPWHGYQYEPDSGASPAPFTEKIPTFRVKIEAGQVWVHEQPYPPGTKQEPAIIPA